MQNRRAFFNTIFSIAAPSEAKKFPVRPPYAKDESLFQKHCPECNAPCVNACEEAILIRGKNGIPELSFSDSGCTYCDACAQACELGVLSLQHATTQIQANIRVNTDKCLSWHGTMCFSCKDPCAQNAIVFNGLFKPTIDTDLCTRCGLCISPCPSQAVDLTAIPLMEVHA